MDEQTKLAFTFANELSEQLITLATGILALTVTFTKDVVKRISAKGAGMLAGAWIFYFISILCGIWTLMALTGTLAPMKISSANLKLAENVRIPSLLQISSFLFATIMIIVYGTITLVRFRSTNSGARGASNTNIKNFDSQNNLSNGFKSNCSQDDDLITE